VSVFAITGDSIFTLFFLTVSVFSGRPPQRIGLIRVEPLYAGHRYGKPGPKK